ncbi:MAG: hypothetical protein WD314_01435 [Trueperaceae bacterium]
MSLPGASTAVSARLFSLLVLAALLLAGTTWAQDENYYPSSDGLSWTYSSGETQTLSGPREFEGIEVMVLTHYFDGTPVSEDYLLFNEGVSSLGSATGGKIVSYIPPLQVYAPGPLSVGRRWESSTRVSGFEITLTAEVVAVRGVNTPAGRFNALQIRQVTTTSSGAQTSLDLYFVPGVGIVRFETNDGTVIDLIDRTF